MNHIVFNYSVTDEFILTSDNIELWWDLSTLTYEEWRKDLINSVPGELHGLMDFQLTKLWDERLDSKGWFFSCVNTGLLLAKTALYKSQEQWRRIIEGIIHANPDMDYRQIAWKAYKEVCKLGAERYMPLFERSGFKHGFISVQLDPTVITDTVELVKKGLELEVQQPNTMVQVPATKAGIQAIFILTSLGIATNATLCFTLPQIMAVAEAVKEGKRAGEKCGIDYSKWLSVITLVPGRLEDANTFTEQATERGIELNDEIKRWAGAAVIKKACRILKERDFPCKILIASGELSAKQNDIEYIGHIEKLANCNLLFSVNFESIKSSMLSHTDRTIKNLAGESVPEEVMEGLLKIPYFVEAYGENTIMPEDFEVIEPTITTNNQFINGVIDFENYVKSILLEGDRKK